jgi:hypothetical protein
MWGEGICSKSGWILWDHNFAIIGHDWRDFGKLPAYEFGGWRENMEATQSQLERTARCGKDCPLIQSSICVSHSNGEDQNSQKRNPTSPGTSFQTIMMNHLTARS